MLLVHDYPKMGEWFEVKAIVKKVKRHRTVIQERKELPETKKMMYLGRRTISSGDIDTEWADGGGYISTFIPKSYIKVYLFVEAEHLNPVRVLPEDIELVST